MAVCTKEKEKDETKPESIEAFLQDMHLLQKIVTFLRYFGLFLFVWLLGWLGFSCQWILIAAIGYYILKTKQEKREWKLKVGQALAKDEEEVIRARLGDLPSWVSFFEVMLCSLFHHKSSIIVAAIPNTKRFSHKTKSKISRIFCYFSGYK